MKSMLLKYILAYEEPLEAILREDKHKWRSQLESIGGEGGVPIYLWLIHRLDAKEVHWDINSGRFSTELNTKLATAIIGECGKFYSQIKNGYLSPRDKHKSVFTYGYQTIIAKPFALSEKEVDWSRHYGTSYDHDIGIFVSMAQMFRLREEEWRQHGKHLYITAFPYGCSVS